MKLFGRFMWSSAMIWSIAAVCLLARDPSRPTTLITSLALSMWAAGFLTGGRVAVWTIRGTDR